MSHYYQLIYRSRFNAASGGPSSLVRDIVSASEKNNSRDRVTGFLVFDKIHFMQILEGSQASVEKTFDRIARDSRHSEILILHSRRVEERSFAEWAMGGAIRSPEIQHIFDTFGSPDLFEPSTPADDLIAFAQDVARWEAERDRQRGLSAR